MNQEEYLGPAEGNNRTSDAKKLILILLAAIVVLVLARTVFYDPWRHYRTVPFDEMEYLRPDSEAFCAKVDELILSVKEGTDWTKTAALVDEVNAAYGAYSTQSVLAYVHYSLDTEDEFYLAEQEFYNENDSVVSQKLEEFFYAAAKSEQKEQLETEVFGDGFFDAYQGESGFDEAVVALMQEEARLMNRYTALTSDPKITFQGQELSYRELLSRELTDQERREAVEIYLDTYNPAAVEIYCELVKVRNKIASALGYESYADYSYDGYFRSFSVKEGADYCAWVEKHLVPLYRQLEKQGTLTEASQLFLLEEGDLWEFLDGAVAQMQPVVKEAYEFMKKFGLCRMSDDPARMLGSYTTYLLDYDAPVIVAQATGTSEDLSTVAHEFGHFLDYYLTYGAQTGIDLAECSSQGMELLLFSRLNARVNEEDAEVLLRSRLFSLLEAIVEQSSFHRFELAVYALSEEELTVERVNALAKEHVFFLEQGVDPELEQRGWFQVKHFFTSPFYTLSYALSADAALQVYELDVEGKGMDAYLNLLRGEERYDFSAGLEAAGFADPFSEERLIARKEFFGELSK